MQGRYFIVHGRVSCPYCVKAVSLLEEKNISYIFSPVAGELLKEVKKKWDYKTVPVVVERDLHYIEHENFIGGYEDLYSYLSPEAIEGGSHDLDSNHD